MKERKKVKWWEKFEKWKSKLQKREWVKLGMEEQKIEI